MCDRCGELTAKSSTINAWRSISPMGDVGRNQATDRASARRNGRASSSEQIRPPQLAASLIPHRDENGAFRFGMSRQFGVMFTEPARPQSLRRGPRSHLRSNSYFLPFSPGFFLRTDTPITLARPRVASTVRFSFAATIRSDVPASSRARRRSSSSCDQGRFPPKRIMWISP